MYFKSDITYNLSCHWKFKPVISKGFVFSSWVIHRLHVHSEPSVCDMLFFSLTQKQGHCLAQVTHLPYTQVIPTHCKLIVAGFDSIWLNSHLIFGCLFSVSKDICDIPWWGMRSSWINFWLPNSESVSNWKKRITQCFTLTRLVTGLLRTFSFQNEWYIIN